MKETGFIANPQLQQSANLAAASARIARRNKVPAQDTTGFVADPQLITQSVKLMTASAVAPSPT